MDLTKATLNFSDNTIHNYDSYSNCSKIIEKDNQTIQVNDIYYSLLDFIENQYLKIKGNSKLIRILEVGAIPMWMDRLMYHFSGFKPDKIFNNLDMIQFYPFMNDFFESESTKLPVSLQLAQVFPNKFKVCLNDIFSPNLEIKIGTKDNYETLTNEKIELVKSNIVVGDFTKEETQEEILKKLGGNPNIIYGSFVFINDLGKHIKEDQFNKSILKDKNESYLENLGQSITKEAFNLLKENGFLIAFNGVNVFNFDLSQIAIGNRKLFAYNPNTCMQVYKK